MEMIKKLINYFWSVIKKYGIILPAAIAVVGFGVMLTLDILDVPTKLLQNDLAWLFIVLVVLVAGALGYGVYYTYTKFTDKELGIHDLGITCIGAIAILSLISFFFTTRIFSGITLARWIVIIAVAALSIVLAIFRTKNVD
jgi:drug/metabolite transporter (DMT)-like permease